MNRLGQGKNVWLLCCQWFPSHDYSFYHLYFAVAYKGNALLPCFMPV